MQDIACEKVFDNYNHPTDGLGLSQRAGIGTISLADLSFKGDDNGSGTSFEPNNTNNSSSDRPDGSQPHKMSEFYGYDHDATPSLTSFQASSSSTFSGVCLAIANQTYYHNGSGTFPVANDVVYTNSSGSSTLSSGYYRFDPLGTDRNMQIGSNGVVSSINTCSGGFGGGNP